MITIRKAKSSDFEDYYKYWCILQKDDIDSLPKSEKVFSKRNPKTQKSYCKKDFLKRIKDSKVQYFLALDNKKTIGYIEVAYTLFKNTSRIIKKRGWICEIILDKEYQGKGIASLLKKQGVVWLKKQGVQFVFVDFDPKNKKAERAYKKWGFKTHYISERMMKI